MEEEVKVKTLGSFFNNLLLKLSIIMENISDKYGLVNNDITTLGVKYSLGPNTFGWIMLIGATIACTIVLGVILSIVYSNRRVSTDDTNAMLILIPAFAVIGFFIFPGARVCILGPLLGFFLSLIFSKESKKRLAIKYWNVPNDVIDTHFQKYRRLPKFVLAMTFLAILFAAKYLPDDWWMVKYHVIAIIGAIVSGILTSIQFKVNPFPSEEELIPPSARVRKEPERVVATSNGNTVVQTAGTNQSVTANITYESAMAELNALVGMQSIKKDVEIFANRVKVEKITSNGKNNSSIAYHCLLTGNPGTGKTTVARILAKVFYAIGLLPTAKCIEVGREGLIGQYQGHTAEKVKKVCDEAMGGVLFIDEAYSLIKDETDSFGKEAINTLLTTMENNRGKFIVIAAGYDDEMRKFLASNSGLESRFNKRWHIDDYTDEELYEIAIKKFESQGKHLDDSAKDVLHKLVKTLSIKRGTKGYANARLIRDVSENTLQNLSMRIASEYDINDVRNTEKIQLAASVITAKDIPFEDKTDTKSAFEELNSMIGMKNLKEEITNLANSIKMDMKRNPGTKHSVHIVLTGNPGTGKTTVARILAKLFNEIGLLPENKLIEADRSKLVVGYIGQTAPNVDKVCDEAMGGVLFIDEAYSLAPKYERDFGQEAIQKLLVRMENNRGQFSVIAAGYKEEMENFISSNDGLKSRFTYSFNFEDYLPEEMLELFLLYVKLEKFIVNEDVKPIALDYFKQMYENRTKKFANGRSVRNFFDTVKQNQNNRLCKIPESEQTNDVISTIIKEDLEGIDINKYI